MLLKIIINSGENYLIIFAQLPFLYDFFLYNINLAKLQITLLKLWYVWILYLEVSKFGFYIIKFESI